RDAAGDHAAAPRDSARRRLYPARRRPSRTDRGQARSGKVVRQREPGAPGASPPRLPRANRPDPRGGDPGPGALSRRGRSGVAGMEGAPARRDPRSAGRVAPEDPGRGPRVEGGESRAPGPPSRPGGHAALPLVRVLSPPRGAPPLRGDAPARARGLTPGRSRDAYLIATARVSWWEEIRVLR